jgi:tetratricopeptide (TPR) repeat protein
MKAVFLLLLATLSPCAVGQTLWVGHAGGQAPRDVLTVEARDVPVLDLLTRAAAATGTRLRVEPAILTELGGRVVNVSRERILLDELAILLGARLGLRARVDAGALVVARTPDSEGAASEYALAHVEHALLAYPEPQLMASLRRERARLLFDCGRWADAAEAYAGLARESPNHPSAADARILVVSASMRAGLHAEALAALAQIEQSRQGIPDVPGAELLPARIHAAAGNWKEALVRARRVATCGRSERDRAVAGLMAAEVQQKLGDGEGMLASVRSLPAGFERAFRDLVPVAELATGAALKLLRDERAALLHLRIALRTVEPKIRAGVACMIAECFVALGQPVPACVALQQAEALEKSEAGLRAIRVRRAEIEESIGALGRATETCAAILQAATGPFPETDRVLATLARCLIASDRVVEARATLEALADREAWRGWALFRLASLERGARDPEKALRALGRLAAADLKPPGPSAEAVRKLRGELLLEIGDPLQAADVFRGSKEEVPR